MRQPVERSYAGQAVMSVADERFRSRYQHCTAKEQGQEVRERALAAGDSRRLASAKGKFAVGLAHAKGVGHRVTASLLSGGEAINRRLSRTKHAKGSASYHQVRQGGGGRVCDVNGVLTVCVG